MKLKNTNGTVIFEANVQSMKELVELAVSQGISLADANLTDANLTDANLTWANLTNANLTDTNLTNANLTDANLTDANLTNANLTDANLINANLTNANLTRANLFYANLSYANLSYANLFNANLSYANLTCANLTYADLAYANLTNADLAHANLSNAVFTSFQVFQTSLTSCYTKSVIRDLMILDAQSHPNPKLFDKYTVTSRECPYNSIRSFDRVVPFFVPDPALWVGWRKAKSTPINTYNLCKRIFKDLRIEYGNCK